ncbi:putative uncharacterized protein DDB_G0282133 isoform X2 [Gordionus sp. m RMFG-2023]|uniref:putative uncharacterized protein DDB_G0282133 isoform X2 n=1 Tax=Gordionus sp. m RMFG-2023 TaxID=3053472 RepID=UPI0031FDF0BA
MFKEDIIHLYRHFDKNLICLALMEEGTSSSKPSYNTYSCLPQSISNNIADHHQVTLNYKQGIDKIPVLSIKRFSSSRDYYNQNNIDTQIKNNMDMHSNENISVSSLSTTLPSFFKYTNPDPSNKTITLNSQNRDFSFLAPLSKFTSPLGVNSNKSQGASSTIPHATINVNQLNNINNRINFVSNSINEIMNPNINVSKRTSPASTLSMMTNFLEEAVMSITDENSENVIQKNNANCLDFNNMTNIKTLLLDSSCTMNIDNKDKNATNISTKDYLRNDITPPLDMLLSSSSIFPLSMIDHNLNNYNNHILLSSLESGMIGMNHSSSFDNESNNNHLATYATLTPLQPLPSILSTVTEKFFNQNESNDLSSSMISHEHLQHQHHQQLHDQQQQNHHMVLLENNNQRSNYSPLTHQSFYNYPYSGSSNVENEKKQLHSIKLEALLMQADMNNEKVNIRNLTNPVLSNQIQHLQNVLRSDIFTINDNESKKEMENFIANSIKNEIYDPTNIPNYLGSNIQDTSDNDALTSNLIDSFQNQMVTSTYQLLNNNNLSALNIMDSYQYEKLAALGLNLNYNINPTNNLSNTNSKNSTLSFLSNDSCINFINNNLNNISSQSNASTELQTALEIDHFNYIQHHLQLRNLENNLTTGMSHIKTEQKNLLRQDHDTQKLLLMAQEIEQIPNQNLSQNILTLDDILSNHNTNSFLMDNRGDILSKNIENNALDNYNILGAGNSNIVIHHHGTSTYPNQSKLSYEKPKVNRTSQSKENLNNKNAINVGNYQPNTFAQSNIIQTNSMIPQQFYARLNNVSQSLNIPDHLMDIYRSEENTITSFHNNFDINGKLPNIVVIKNDLMESNKHSKKNHLLGNNFSILTTDSTHFTHILNDNIESSKMHTDDNIFGQHMINSDNKDAEHFSQPLILENSSLNSSGGCSPCSTPTLPPPITTVNNFVNNNTPSKEDKNSSSANSNTNKYKSKNTTNVKSHNQGVTKTSKSKHKANNSSTIGIVEEDGIISMSPMTLSSAPILLPDSKCASIINLSDQKTISDLNNNNMGSTSGSGGEEMEEINTKDLAQKISSELKRYSIPQAVFAQRVLCRSQGTLSDLLRNPKPWSKLKSGRETFRRMSKWLDEPEFQRMSALRLAAVGKNDITIRNKVSKKKEDKLTFIPEPIPEHQILNIPPNVASSESSNSSNGHKKPRLVFTDIQRRTLQAIFKETKRPSKEMQSTIAQQLGLDLSTVGNFFMNARRRSLDKWRDDRCSSSTGSLYCQSNAGDEDFEEDVDLRDSFMDEKYDKFNEMDEVNDYLMDDEVYTCQISSNHHTTNKKANSSSLSSSSQHLSSSHKRAINRNSHINVGRRSTLEGSNANNKIHDRNSSSRRSNRSSLNKTSSAINANYTSNNSFPCLKDEFNDSSGTEDMEVGVVSSTTFCSEPQNGNGNNNLAANNKNLGTDIGQNENNEYMSATGAERLCDEDILRSDIKDEMDFENTYDPADKDGKRIAASQYYREGDGEKISTTTKEAQQCGANKFSENTGDASTDKNIDKSQSTLGDSSEIDPPNASRENSNDINRMHDQLKNFNNNNRRITAIELTY